MAVLVKHVYSMVLQIMFIYVDTAEENLAKPFLTLYGLESEKKPTVSFTLDSQLILYAPFAVNARVPQVGRSQFSYWLRPCNPL
jgi:hypothetical protein